MPPLLEKISLKKNIMQIRDFHINLLHFDIDKKPSRFIDNIYSNSSFTTTNLIDIPSSSKTLINNIF